MLRQAIHGRWSALSPGGRQLLIALALVLAVTALALALLWVTHTENEDGPAEQVDTDRIVAAASNGGAASDGDDGPAGDPFAFAPSRRTDLAEGAARAYSHVLYEKSPGGIVASARRTARWRREIERAAADHGTDPDLMEAMVLLESAGRPDVIAGSDPEVASGLAQIVASTGTDLLGMDVDLPRSQALTRELERTGRQIAAAENDARSPKPRIRSAALLRLRRLSARGEALVRQRRAADERFQPVAALDGMGTYLELATDRFGDPELATVSYHMGIGNLETAIGRYLGEDATDGAAAELVASGDLDYARLFFDSSPLSHERAWSFLASLGDDSSTYLWRVLAARRIMELFRDDPEELRRLNRLQTAKATQEEVFHPEGRTEVFADAEEIEAATEAGELVRLGTGEGLFRVDRRMGELAPNFGAEPSLYRALRPEALAALVYMTARVRRLNGGEGKLTVTSTVRDEGYQGQLVGINLEATRAYSLHTTGYSFDVLREYGSDRQAKAFQFVLDRLRALDVIDYAVEPEVIHVTVSDEAGALLE